MRVSNLLRKITPKKIREVLSYQTGDEFSKKIYSQEGEDMLLSRVFDHQPTGFYVDVGAHHPFRFSNTKLLYDKGWSGINIEPNPDIAEFFKKHRPRDIFINMGISKANGELDYYMYQHPALNTFDSKLVESKEERPLKIEKIQTAPLSQILPQHIDPEKSIDLLTIDAEGMDLEILKSNDWTRFKPMFLIVESPVVSLPKFMESEMYQYIEEQGYILHSKLWKSCLFKLGAL